MNPFLSKRSLSTALFAVVALAGVSSAGDEGVRYKDRLFKNVSIEKDIVYASDVMHLSSDNLHYLSSLAQTAGSYIYFYNDEYQEIAQDLKLDLYTPVDDSEDKRAAVIVIHGGAMVAGAKDDKTQKSVAYCDSLAARGFVVASIEYRMGVTLNGSLDPFFFGKSADLTIYSDDFARSVYRGLQDVNAAVRYMRKNADELNIDPNKIYLVGNSAGAILSIENIYANTKDDFPSYIDNPSYLESSGLEVPPDLGPVDRYGEQGFDSHANGGVFLWGAIHDPKLIKKNKTPVLLIHGSEDKTVLPETGQALSNAKATLTGLLPPTFAGAADKINLTVNTPVLYGSHVIDSVLTANGVDHETYFVEGVGHEFYNDDAYTEEVQARVFDFLYNLASSDPIVKAFAAVTVSKSNDNKLHAVIDGDYNRNSGVFIDEDVRVDDVSFDRAFTVADEGAESPARSTIVLPFEIEARKVVGLSQVLEFSKVDYIIDKETNEPKIDPKTGNKVMGVHVNYVWCAEGYETVGCPEEENGMLLAYKPYIVELKTGVENITFDMPAEGVILKKTPSDLTDLETRSGNWVFRTALQYKKWNEKDDSDELTGCGGKSCIYGYAAEDMESKKTKGKFVRIASGAYIYPLRAYLAFEKPKMLASANASYALHQNMVDLPDDMDVVVSDKEGKTTVIGSFSTRTGEFHIYNMKRTYDLKGRRVNGSNNARGVYYGKKVLMK